MKLIKHLNRKYIHIRKYDPVKLGFIVYGIVMSLLVILHLIYWWLKG